MKLVHCRLTGGLFFGTATRVLVGPQPSQTPPRCIKCNSLLVNGQRFNSVEDFHNLWKSAHLHTFCPKVRGNVFIYQILRPTDLVTNWPSPTKHYVLLGLQKACSYFSLWTLYRLDVCWHRWYLNLNRSFKPLKARTYAKPTKRFVYRPKSGVNFLQ